MTNKHARNAVAVVLLVLASNTARGACALPRIVSSAFPRGSISYIQTPGVEAGSSGSTITASFEAHFWALGLGDPRHERGHDSGTFLARGQALRWIVEYPGYPAFLDTTWAATRLIDGCIDAAEASPRCTAVLLSDQVGGRGYFAFLTASAVVGDYSFAQAENRPIVLATIPPPTVSGTAITANGVLVSTRVERPGAGLYQSCSGDTMSGYRLYARTVDRGEPTPIDRDRRGIEAPWRLIDAGAPFGTGPMSFGESVQLAIPCEETEDLYLAASIVFDSGFETFHLSENAPRVACGE